MNEPFFTEFENPLPRDEVRLLKCTTELSPNRDALKLLLELTPFEDRPSMEVQVFSGEKLLACTSVVEVIQPKNEVMLHLLTEPNEGTIIKVQVYYLDIKLPEEGKELELPQRQVVNSFQQELAL